MSDRKLPHDTDRRRFLRGMAAMAVGVAFAPAVKRVLGEAIDHAPRRRGTRWIGHC